MTQHNPNLSLNHQGKGVVVLHIRLINLGYTIATPEILNELFSESTQLAVQCFQQAQGLPVPGIVDATTKRL